MSYEKKLRYGLNSRPVKLQTYCGQDLWISLLVKCLDDIQQYEVKAFVVTIPAKNMAIPVMLLYRG